MINTGVVFNEKLLSQGWVEFARTGVCAGTRAARAGARLSLAVCQCVPYTNDSASCLSISQTFYSRLRVYLRTRRGFGKSANSKGFERSQTLAQPGPSQAHPLPAQPALGLQPKTLSRQSRPWGYSWETQAGKAGVGVPGGALGVLRELPRGRLQLSGPKGRVGGTV